MTNLQDFTNRSEVGAIKPWGKATAPVGYVLCDGSAISRTTYADLFAVIASTYGAGNGSTTFNVPNLQGKTPQGYDGNTYNLAATGGANTVTVAVTNNQAVSVTGSISNTALTEAQLASHTHTYQKRSAANPPPRYGGGAETNWFGLAATSATGSGTGHTHAHTLSGTLTGSVAVAGNNTFSPYVVVNYIIKH
jgi:microcystin-dependent protein